MRACSAPLANLIVRGLSLLERPNNKMATWPTILKLCKKGSKYYEIQNAVGHIYVCYVRVFCVHAYIKMYILLSENFLHLFILSIADPCNNIQHNTHILDFRKLCDILCTVLKKVRDIGCSAHTHSRWINHFKQLTILTSPLSSSMSTLLSLSSSVEKASLQCNYMICISCINLVCVL